MVFRKTKKRKDQVGRFRPGEVQFERESRILEYVIDINQKILEHVVDINQKI